MYYRFIFIFRSEIRCTRINNTNRQYSTEVSFFLRFAEFISSFCRFSMFRMVIERLFLPELSKVEENEKKLCAIAVTHLLCDPLPMINGLYSGPLWLPLLQALLQLFESSHELQTMSAAEKKKQIHEAEEEFIVGLDDTPGKSIDRCSDENQRTNCFFSFNQRLHTGIFVFGFCKKTSYRYIQC